MRDLSTLDGWRRTDGHVIRCFGSIGDHTRGLFEMPSPTDGGTLQILAAVANGWDHVSVSRRNRCPTWPEMTHIAALFFKDDEMAMLLHLPTVGRASPPSYCVDWWRPHGQDIPRPPSMIGVDSAAPLFGGSPEAMFLELLR